MVFYLNNIFFKTTTIRLVAEMSSAGDGPLSDIKQSTLYAILCMKRKQIPLWLLLLLLFILYNIYILLRWTKKMKMNIKMKILSSCHFHQCPPACPSPIIISLHHHPPSTSHKQQQINHYQIQNNRDRRIIITNVSFTLVHWAPFTVTVEQINSYLVHT